MNIRVLRRNRRTNPIHPIIARKDFVLFIVSLVVFFGGMTSLAWAVHAHPQPPDNQAHISSEAANQTTSSEQTYTGDIKAQRSAKASSSTSASASASASASVSSATSTPAPTSSAAQQGENTTPAHSTEAHATQGQAQQEGPAATTPQYVSDTPAETSTEEISYHVVHHTAYQAVPIYRTVHHQASIAHEVRNGAATSIEWSACPVCGDRHDSAYNERVIDHVNESFCSACGGRHGGAYDEIVYD